METVKEKIPLSIEPLDETWQVSLFEKVISKKCSTVVIVRVLQAIKHGKYRQQIESIRQASTKKEKNALKKELLSCITVSGLFNNSHRSEDIQQHSGLIQVDFDNVPDISTFKEQLIQDQYTFACFISPGGQGLKAIVKIKPDIQRHQEEFSGLSSYYLNTYGKEIDQKCKDIGRLMYVSYDPELYYNPNSKVYNNTINPSRPEADKATYNEDVEANVKQLVEQIESNQIDITAGYDNWLKIGFALADELGEVGREYFHRISRFHIEYEQNICNRQYNECLKQRKSGITIKSLYYLAQQHNINLVPQKAQKKEVQKLKDKKLSKFEKVENYLNEVYEIRYNEISNEIECKEKDEEDFKPLNENNVYRMLQHNHIPFSLTNLAALLRSDFIPVYNPIKNYFESLPEWSEHTDPDYISNLCQFIQVKDQKRFNQHFRKMLVRCIACSLTDGTFNKQAFILVHEKQNSGKSTFCRWLCPPQLKKYYAENISIDKDSLISLNENFFINLDELATLSKLELNSLKSMFSKDYIKIRRPFERKATVTPRRANFIGSTNKTEFLTDETGSVRWLCFEIESINWDYAKLVDIDQVWAQAYALFISGFKYELTAEEVEENERANKDYQIRTAEMDLIQRYYSPGTKDNHQVFYTATELQSNLSEKTNGSVRLHPNNIGRALTWLGFERSQKFNGVYQVKGYYLNFINE